MIVDSFEVTEHGNDCVFNRKYMKFPFYGEICYLRIERVYGWFSDGKIDVRQITKEDYEEASNK